MDKKHLYEIIERNATYESYYYDTGKLYIIYSVLPMDVVVSYSEYYIDGNCFATIFSVHEKLGKDLTYFWRFNDTEGMVEDGDFKFSNVSRLELIVKLQSLLDNYRYMIEKKKGGLKA